MRLTHLEVTDHRNIAHAELHPDPHLTCWRLSGC